MRLIKNFWGDLKGSFFNKGFYKSVPTRPFSKGMKFIVFLTLISTLVVGAVISYVGVTALKGISLENIAAQYYPPQLVVTIKKGIASSNVPEPFVIPVPQEMKTRSKNVHTNVNVEEYTNILVIDTRRTSSEISLGELEKYDSFAVLTKDALIARDDGAKVIPLKGIDELVISKENVATWATKLENFLWGAIPFLIVGGFILGTIFSFLWYLAAFLLLAFIPMLISRISGVISQKLTYAQSYKVSMYAIAPVVVVSSLWTIFSMLFGFMGFPFLLSLLFFIVVVFVGLKENKKVVV